MRTGDRILVTVRTYPELSKTYGETVCTAGLREDGTWVRLYPVPFRRLDEGEQYRLYDWITCPLTKHSGDARPESYRPTGEIERVDHVGTSDNWRERRELLLGRPRIYGSLDEIIRAAKNNVMSLAIFKPAQVIDFGWEATDREWDPGKLDAVRGITAQPDLFDDQSWRRTFQIVDKVPYNFHYRIEDANGRTSRMRILEWQLGALYRNCLRLGTGGLPTRGRSSGSFRLRMRSSEICSRSRCQRVMHDSLARRKARPTHPLRVELPARLLRELVEAALAQEPVQSRVERVVQRPDRTGRDEQLLLPRPGHPAYRHRRNLSLRSLCTPNSTHSQRPRRTDFIHGLLVDYA